ncbi:uncharacterized protein LOC114889304 [Monodon monoceros]|uniref:uncharacterized protein LOC114889304 n=1 Tax=Monodon monoceros TaxID=40151 RepID=UPI0010F9F765|nr:uncharacterized protein LOC114889304 [Monodon monoceros]
MTTGALAPPRTLPGTRPRAGGGGQWGVSPAVRSDSRPRPLRNRVTFCPGLNSLLNSTFTESLLCPEARDPPPNRGENATCDAPGCPFIPTSPRVGAEASAGRLCGAGRGTSVQEVRGQASQMPLDPRILGLHARDQLARLLSISARRSPDLGPGPHSPPQAATDGSSQRWGWAHSAPSSAMLPASRWPSGQPELRAGWRRGDETSQVAPGA